MDFDIITIGDTTTDVFLQIDESSKLCSVDKKSLELKFRYAGKIPVKDMHKVIGAGNAANHAVGASRLGLKTAIYSIVGLDHSGSMIKHMLEDEQISTSYLKTDKSKKTNYSTVLDYKGDRTILVYHEDREYSLPKFTKTKWIYFSSICGNHAEFNRELHNFVVKKKVKLGFNPGSKQMKLGARKLKPILSVTEVLFVNKQEAQRLTKKTKDIKKLLVALKDKGPKIVVITDGQEGSYCFDEKNMYKIGILGLPVVERTGCGDAYASGFVAALNYGYDIEEAMRWGSANGAAAAMSMGSHEGLLKKVQLERLLKQRKDFHADKI